MITKSFHHEIDAVQEEFIGKLNGGYGNTFKAISASTAVAIEMDMELTKRAHTVIAANGIFNGTRTIVDTVNQQVFMKKGQCTKNSRFVDGFKNRFQIGEAKGSSKSSHGFKN